MEWRGFGTEEDERYLESVNLFSTPSSYYNDSSYYSPQVPLSSSGLSIDDYQSMQADDSIFDTFDFDRELARARLNSLPHLPLNPVISNRPVLKKSWRDVVGTEHVQPPAVQTPPAIPKAPEEIPEPKQEVKEVCRYWLNVCVLRVFDVG